MSVVLQWINHYSSSKSLKWMKIGCLSCIIFIFIVNTQISVWTEYADLHETRMWLNITLALKVLWASVNIFFPYCSSAVLPCCIYTIWALALEWTKIFYDPFTCEIHLSRWWSSTKGCVWIRYMDSFLSIKVIYINSDFTKMMLTPLLQL